MLTSAWDGKSMPKESLDDLIKSPKLMKSYFESYGKIFGQKLVEKLREAAKPGK